MHNTDTSIEDSMVPDKEDAVQSHVSYTSPLPFERPATPITSEYEVSVFRDVEAAVVPDIVCNSGLILWIWLLSTMRPRMNRKELHGF